MSWSDAAQRDAEDRDQRLAPARAAQAQARQALAFERIANALERIADQLEKAAKERGDG